MQEPLKHIKLIIGLGNPTSLYQNTYHNLGKIFIRYLLKKKQKLPFIILENESYMNEAGVFVKKILKKYKIKPQQILVAHDDNDINLGRFKLSFNKSAGGHKGVESIINNLKTKEFWRLRIGIQNQNKKIKAENFVLKKISLSHQKIFKKTFEEILKKYFNNSRLT